VADAVPAPFTDLFDDSLTPSEVAERCPREHQGVSGAG
jgi:hypothetical protein